MHNIAGAHIAAEDSTSALPLAMNVGTGCGGYVRDLIKLVDLAAGRNDVAAVEADRRAGDPAF